MKISSRPDILARALVSPLEIRLVNEASWRNGCVMVRFTINPVASTIKMMKKAAMADDIRIG